MTSRFESLPDELLDEIFVRFNRDEQYNTALVSWHCYYRVVPHLYRTVELVDCSNEATGDEHDDTPMIRILLTLAKNPYVASKVHDLTHRCHVSVPDVFTDLPMASLQNPELSQDGRTLRLLSRAIHSLVNVNTLRIIYGHHRVTVGLLQGFFSTARNYQLPVARLWLESCSLEGVAQRVGVNALLGCLQSVRIRRLRAKSELSTIGDSPVWFGERRRRLRTIMSDRAPYWDNNWILDTLENNRVAASLDEGIYECFPGVERLAEADCDVDNSLGDSTCPDAPYSIDEEPAWLAWHLVTASRATLTSLNLDWVLHVMPLMTNDWITHTTFPNLRAFQVRNAVTTETRFDQNTTISLLEGNWLQFLERHPQIQCLAWPLEHFFHPTSPPYLTARAEAVVTTLGRTLKELRIDVDVNFHEEPETDQRDVEDWIPQRASVRRRFFIEHIAPHLSALEVLKIEGGIPFDERSEVVRAVRFSPLRKLVAIGVSFPPTDAWSGISPEDRRTLVQDRPDLHAGAHSDPSQDSVTVEDWTMLQAHALSPSTPFVPKYNPSRYSLLDTIALHHASTITTLKFCGFKYAPDIHKPTNHSLSMLDPLRHLHNLRNLILSFWMACTQFEDSDVDDQLRSYWLDTQSPTSTALAMPASAYDENPWAKILTDAYAPAKLAENVATLLAGRLSKRALAREGGISVKALLLLGGHEIFDLDIQLDAHGEMASYRGPRSENDAEVIKEKMERRAWF